MEWKTTRPVFFTITGPTCSGKSTLLNYIRAQGLPCVVGTTTRPPRPGEREGVDYYFISEEESIELEKNNQFAGLAKFSGNRYGCTKSEFNKKINQGIAFLIIEPSGLNHYSDLIRENNAIWIRSFVSTDARTRIDRFKNRLRDSCRTFISEDFLFSALERFESMLTNELNWIYDNDWDLLLDGEETVEYNFKEIYKYLIRNNLIQH